MCVRIFVFLGLLLLLTSRKPFCHVKAQNKEHVTRRQLIFRLGGVSEFLDSALYSPKIVSTTTTPPRVQNERNTKGTEISPDQLYNLQKKLIPSKQETRDSVQSLITNSLNEKEAADWVIPLQAVVNATLNGGPYPTIVPDQVGPVPTKNDVWCNPAIVPGGCTTFGNWGRAFGGPARLIYEDSRIGRTQQRAGDKVNNFEDVVTKGWTSTLVDYVEHDATVEALVDVASKIRPITNFDAQTNPYWLALTNTTETLFWQPLEQSIDPRDGIRQSNELLKLKRQSSAWCRAFNGRAPNCEPVDIIPPTLPVFPTGGPVNDQGFYETIFVWGFEFSCTVQGSCTAGTPNLQPENFDGFYTFFDVDERGMPIYATRTFFIDFNAIQVLFIWQQTFESTLTEQLSGGGSWAAITPTFPNFDAASARSRPPFAFLEGSLPPQDCLNIPSGNPDDQFPICTSGSENWRFGRASSTGCGGVQVSILCFYPVFVNFNPSDVPV